MTAVDRTHPLASPEFADANPDRVHVISNSSWLHDGRARWTVWRGDEPLRDFPTHTEAIRWAQSRAAIDKHPNATRYTLDSPRKQGQDARTDAVGGPNHTHVIPGPQNGSNDLDHFPAPMEAP